MQDKNEDTPFVLIILTLTINIVNKNPYMHDCADKDIQKKSSMYSEMTVY